VIARERSVRLSDWSSFFIKKQSLSQEKLLLLMTFQIKDISKLLYIST
jgi:hypothetical protein